MLGKELVRQERELRSQESGRLKMMAWGRDPNEVAEKAAALGSLPGRGNSARQGAQDRTEWVCLRNRQHTKSGAQGEMGKVVESR